MKTDRKQNEDEILADAILANQDWNALNSSLRNEALASFRTHVRRRRIHTRIAQTAALIVVSALAIFFSHSRKMAPPQPTAVVESSPSSDVIIRNFSDEELLALFPKGSCIIAEIDGQRELVILDAEMAERGFVVQQH